MPRLRKEIRARIYRHYKGLCADCQAAGEVIHHVQARARGGSDNVENLELLCNRCHAKHHPYIKRLEGYSYAVRRKTFFGDILEVRYE